MKPDCLNERDLILLHYGEVPERTTPAAAAAHFAACPACRARLEQLAADLARIPAEADPDPAVATRIAARVTERLHRKPRWQPAAGAVVAGAVALAMAVIVWIPHNRQPPISSQQPAISLQRPVTSSEQPFVGPPRPVVHQATLDLDLLDKLDLLEELETLRAIEGV
jgi:predicted anti-sigma-YlaC factor YlaD